MVSVSQAEWTAPRVTNVDTAATVVLDDLVCRMVGTTTNDVGHVSDPVIFLESN